MTMNYNLLAHMLFTVLYLSLFPSEYAASGYVFFRVNCKPVCCAPPSPASSSSYLPSLLIASFSLVLIQSPTSCLLWPVISISDGLSKWPYQMTDLKMKLKVIKDYRGGKAEAITLQPCPIYHSSHLEEQKQNKGDH